MSKNYKRIDIDTITLQKLRDIPRILQEKKHRYWKRCLHIGREVLSLFEKGKLKTKLIEQYSKFSAHFQIKYFGDLFEKIRKEYKVGSLKGK